MLFVFRRSVKIKYCCLFPIRCPKMTCSVFPSVKTRFVPPLIILSSHYHRIFTPYKALSHFPTHVKAGSSEIISFWVSVPYIKTSSFFHNFICCIKWVFLKFSKVIILHLIILYFQFILCFSFIRNIVRWIS